jgi:hypothetical protein
MMMNARKRSILMRIGLAAWAIAALAGCGFGERSDAPPTPASALPTIDPTATTAPTDTPAPTATAVPTDTPAPTATAAPTSAPAAASGEAAQQAAPAGAATAAPQQQPTVLTFTDAQATELAAKALAENPNALPLPMENPQVSFTRDNIKLVADVRGQNSRVEVLGVPELAGERARFKLTSLKLNGFEMPFYRREIEDAINGIFAGMLGDKGVKSVELGDGVLTVTPVS